MLIDIPSEVALRLQAMADEQGFTVGALLLNWIEPENAEPRYPTLADMARNARAAKLGKGKPVDTSSRSREILQAEFPDYLNGDPGVALRSCRRLRPGSIVGAPLKILP